MMGSQQQYINLKKLKRLAFLTAMSALWEGEEDVVEGKGAVWLILREERE